jgi:hypothetical protein
MPHPKRVPAATILALLLGATPAMSANGVGQAKIVRTSQVVHDAPTGAVFHADLRPDGLAAVSVRLDPLRLEKTISPDGDVEMTLTLDDDVVSVSSKARTGIRVVRNRRTALVPPRHAEASQIDSVRAVLLGSKAVRAFKYVVAELESRQEDDIFVFSTLTDGALIATLDGDVGAVRRIAARLIRRRVSVLNAAHEVTAQTTFTNCWDIYVNTLVGIELDYRRCLVESWQQGGWLGALTNIYCDTAFVARAEGALFQFFACNSIPVK